MFLNGMKFRIVAAVPTLAFVVALSGCATEDRYHRQAFLSYVAANKPLAESGALKWSDYYESVYNLAVLAGAPGETLQHINEMIRNAKQAEAGLISKNEFTYRDRAIRAAETSDGQQRAAIQQSQQTAQLAAVAAILNASQPYTLPAAQPQPASIPLTLRGFLQSQSVDGALRYCKYTNGVVTTIGVMSMCPMNTQ